MKKSGTTKRMFFFVICLVGVGFMEAHLPAQDQPLKLPASYDTEFHLMGNRVNGRMYHSLPSSARLAKALVANGTPEDLAIAEKVIAGVLQCQELRTDAPHYGNFRWHLEEPVVEDLNAVQFALFPLIPIMIDHPNRLSLDLRERLLKAIRLGLEEMRRVDVHLMYTNIVLKDIVNSSLGGELLGDRDIAERGYRKFKQWIEFTDISGAPREYNSTNYTSLAIRVLGEFARLVEHQETQVLARTTLARLALSAALHLNPATKRWSGPHGRAYFGTIAGTNPELEEFRDLVDDGTLPVWVKDALERRDGPIQVVETTDSINQTATSSYHGVSFSLGVATRELSNQANRYIAWQTNPFTVQYRRPSQALPGSVFSRYIVDDEWLGDFQSTPYRGNRGLIPEKGLFRGIHDRERAICLYSTSELNALETHFSGKTVVAWPRWGDLTDEIWIGEKRVSALPADVPRGSTVVVVSGDVMIAIRPLTVTDLGTNAPIRLVELDDRTLLLEMYNYLGPAKTFWELGWPGAFFQGRPQNGFYAEVAERSKFENGGAFARTVEGGELVDEAPAPFTYDGQKPRPWKVQYSRDGRSLEIEVDLMDWSRPSRRWIGKEEVSYPMLESRVARQSRDGMIEVGDAVLRCGRQSAWLFGSPETQRWVAGYHGPEPAPLTLSIPAGKVEIDQIETGIVVWDQGEVTVDALGLKSTPRVTGGRLRSH